MPGPLWGLPKDAYSGMVGLSDSMTPGSISQLILSDAIALRAEFDQAIPSPSQLYWRGPVLWHFDGRSWTAGNLPASLPPEAVEARGDRVSYTVTLEPHNKRWLFMLELPVAAPPEAVLSHDFQLLAHEPVRRRLRYAASSDLRYRLQAELDAPTRRLALQLPDGGNPRTRLLGEQWAASEANGQAIVLRALTMFREQPFVYTLRPPLLGADSVDEFLFSSRRGFCEHYAGSFVFLMRSAGVPARVVTGYQGGELNPAGNYLLVRQTEAHAWAEVWLQERGWVRVDPTAAVSPRRVEAGVAAALPAGEPLPLLSRGDFPWLHKLYLNWDALNNGWNQWVLGYNEKKQLELLSRLTGSAVSWQEMAIWLMASVAAIILAISWLMLRGNRRRVDALQAAYLQFERKLARAGVQRQPYEGPLDFGRRVAAQWPAQAALIHAITRTYARLRYGKDAPTRQVEAFIRQVKRFRP
jgi:transglutaminase-like putative cysteine protease